MTVYLKQDRSKGIGSKLFYFTDGENKITKINYTNKQAEKHVDLLIDLGIEVINKSDYHFTGTKVG